MSPSMDTLLSLLVFAVALGYLAAAGGIWRHLRAGVALWPAQTAAAAALLLHLALLARTGIQDGGLAIGVGTALSLFAWQASLLLWLFSLRQPIAALGLMVYPVAALCAITGVAVPLGSAATAALAWPVQMHILLSLLAYGVLTLGAVQAVAMAIQHRQLHEHRPRGAVASLPALQTMETLLFRLLTAGFFLLTLAIVSGALFIEDLFAQHLAHKTVLSLLAWLAFAVLLWGRWRHGWRGRMAMRWTLGAYGALILAYFGSKLVLEWLLGMHWVT